MSKTGPKPITRSCPLCPCTLDRLGHSAYFRCSGCQKPFILEKGVLRQTRGKRGRLPRVKVEQKESKTGGYLSADGYEKLQGPAPRRKPKTPRKGLR